MPSFTVQPERVLNSTSKPPVWEGPNSSRPNGGITQSLLSRWLCCRERARLYLVEGLTTVDTFDHKLEYGNMFHLCAESCKSNGEGIDMLVWRQNLTSYCNNLCRKYPTQQSEIQHWYEVCKVQFPLYLQYKSSLPPTKSFLREYVFDVTYRLSSRRCVRLRGKWDAVEREGNDNSFWLCEYKTKGKIEELKITRQLTWDLQTMMYLVALSQEFSTQGVGNVVGVNYNVIRRPLSGGKGDIRQHKPTKKNPGGESKEAYYNRVKGVIQDNINEYFYSWKVYVNPSDVVKFCRECLDPILENVLDWWDEVNLSLTLATNQGCSPEYCTPMNWRHPYGVWNPMDNGGEDDIDYYLATGNDRGLMRVDNLFPELKK